MFGGGVARAVALFDAAADFVAFVGAFAEIAGEFEVDAVGGAVFLGDGLHLLAQFGDGFADDGVADLGEVGRGAGGVVEAGFDAGFRIDQAAGEVRVQGAGGGGGDVAGAGEFGEFAALGGVGEGGGEEGVDRQGFQALADRTEVAAEAEDGGDVVEHRGGGQQGAPGGIGDGGAQRGGALGGVAGAGDEVILFVLARDVGEAGVVVEVEAFAEPGVAELFLRAEIGGDAGDFIRGEPAVGRAAQGDAEIGEAAEGAEQFERIRAAGGAPGGGHEGAEADQVVGILERALGERDVAECGFERVGCVRHEEAALEAEDFADFVFLVAAQDGAGEAAAAVALAVGEGGIAGEHGADGGPLGEAFAGGFDGGLHLAGFVGGVGGVGGGGLGV